jgi:hypothetical protein
MLNDEESHYDNIRYTELTALVNNLEWELGDTIFVDSSNQILLGCHHSACEFLCLQLCGCTCVFIWRFGICFYAMQLNMES